MFFFKSVGGKTVCSPGNFSSLIYSNAQQGGRTHFFAMSLDSWNKAVIACKTFSTEPKTLNCGFSHLADCIWAHKHKDSTFCINVLQLIYSLSSLNGKILEWKAERFDFILMFCMFEKAEKNPANIARTFKRWFW